MTDDIQNRYLIFQVDEEYAIDLGSIIQIIDMQNITKIPQTPDYVAGVINLRGQVIPVIDVRKRLQKPDREYTYRTCIIITVIDGVNLGLIVDKVLDLVTIDDDKISPPPPVADSFENVFIKAIGLYENEMKLILDGHKIITQTDLETCLTTDA